MRGGPPRPGAPGVVTPGRRRSTSPTVASPNLSISSRPMTILLAVAWRRCAVSVSRPPVISMRCDGLALAGAGAGAGAAAGVAGRGRGAEAAPAGACAAGAGVGAGVVCAQVLVRARARQGVRQGTRAWDRRGLFLEGMRGIVPAGTKASGAGLPLPGLCISSRRRGRRPGLRRAGRRLRGGCRRCPRRARHRPAGRSGAPSARGPGCVRGRSRPPRPSALRAWWRRSSRCPWRSCGRGSWPCTAPCRRG
jgi:hypothetical protein